MDGESEKAPTQAAMLVQLAMAQCDEFFHDENREAYAIMHEQHDGGVHREVHKLRSKSFKEWLFLTYFDNVNGVPNDNSIRSAIALLGAIARHRGEQREVFVRRAFHEGKLYVDHLRRPLARDRGLAEHRRQAGQLEHRRRAAGAVSACARHAGAA